jgi:Major Facilitator Superfamily
MIAEAVVPGPPARALSNRLRPLYVASFFQSFMLWYGIEKLFMHEIGFNSAQIALSGIFLSASLALFQIPTGILADRWSRKGTLISASLVLILCTAVGALSRNVATYYVNSVLWGLFASIRVGTYDAVIYDTLQEQTGGGDGFEHYFGRVKLLNGVAFVSSALLGGVSAQLFGLRETYWISIPTVLISIVALCKFDEPLVHKSQGTSSLASHIWATMRVVMRRGNVFWIVLPALLFGVLSRITINLSQLWYIPLALPTVFWGIAFAVLELGDGFAGAVAALTGRRRTAQLAVAVVTICAALVLVVRGSVVLVIAAQAALLAGSGVFSIILGRRLHDAVPSSVRTGASSAVGTMAMLVFLPVAYLFGWICNRYTVFQGGWVIVLITVVAITAFCARILPRAEVTPA